MLSIHFSSAFQMSVYMWDSERSKNFAAVFWGLSICFIKDECLIKLEIGRICMLRCAMLCYTILYYVLLYIYTHTHTIVSGVLLIFYKPTKFSLIPDHPVAQGRASQLSCAWNLPGNPIACEFGSSASAGRTRASAPLTASRWRQGWLFTDHN